MKKMNIKHMLRMVTAMILAVAMLLCCGCGPKEPTEPDPKDDGKLEAQDVIDGFTSVYGAALSAMGGQTDTSTRAEVDMTFTLGDDLLATVGSMLQAEGLPGDASWLRQIGLKMDTTRTAAVTKVMMDLRLGQTQLVSAELIQEVASGMVYAALPGLNEQYLGISTAPEGANVVAAPTVDTAALIAALPTEQALNALLSRYLQLVLAHLPEPVETTETLTCNGVSQELTATTHTVRRSQLLDMLEAVLSAAQTDAELEAMLDKLSAWYNGENSKMAAQYGGTWENVDIHQDMTEAIAEALAEIAELRLELEDADFLQCTAFTDEQQTRGLRIRIMDESEPLELTVYSLHQQEKTALLVEMKDQFRLIGSGTEQNGLAGGSYTLSVDGEDVLYVELKDFDTQALEEGKVKGTVSVRLPEATIRELFGYGSFVTPSTVISVALDLTEDGGNMDFELSNGGIFLLGMNMRTKVLQAETVTVPTDYLKLDNEADVNAWVEAIDMQKLLQNLRQAGVPEELVAVLEWYLSA